MKLIFIWAVIALAAYAQARTPAKQQPISPLITSLNDKDAREKARVHPAFSNAGRQAGVEIWRIENFNPVAVAQNDFGKFYKGDSYIILKTTADKRNNLSWDIHYWIGSETSQDEAGAAAILTVGLDDKFDGKAVQHRETMGYESPQFSGYFPRGVRYLDGGVASGFNHVTTNPGAEKRLFQVKGKKNIRVRQVDPLISSMNKGDCFILDVNQDILVYVGDRAKNVEKLKAISMANQIRDQDHNGRGKVEIIDQYSSEVDIQKFFTALGSGSKDLVPEDSAGGDDQTFERKEEQDVTLSEISDSSGSLKVTALTKPFRQEQLKPQECYILDTVSGSIYVWVGKQASKREKSEAMSKAQQYLSAKKYPSWVHIARIPQGTEPAVFKQYFSTWRDVGMSHNRLVRSASASSSSESSSEETHTKMYKVVQITDVKYHFEKMDLKQTQLTKNEVFLLEDGAYIYIWFGKIVPNDLYKSLFIIGDAYKGNFGKHSQKLPVLGLKQGFEPKQFKSLFPQWDDSISPVESTDDMLKDNELI
ncbi:actin depolymerising venom protein gelsolin 1-like [Epargyreus clarus]|uniref:actin depolymerising venom protein gelsolin 1-like n=1 Tax=Epargyreus clarus TaxID=520877 RepID=UPI003C2DA644